MPRDLSITGKDVNKALQQNRQFKYKHPPTKNYHRPEKGHTKGLIRIGKKDK